LAFGFTRFKTKGKIIISTLILLSCIQGYKSYKSDMKKYSVWTQIDANNKKILASISEKVNIECAVLATNMKVRGYANLLFNRGIYEYKSLQDLHKLSNERDACASIYLEGAFPFTDLPKYTKATIMLNEHPNIYITSKEDN
jgi:hypothetical protein